MFLKRSLKKELFPRHPEPVRPQFANGPDPARREKGLRVNSAKDRCIYVQANTEMLRFAQHDKSAFFNNS